MSRIKVRCPEGIEYSFEAREEFPDSVRRGKITGDWEVFHLTKGVWLPMRLHPLFRTAAERLAISGSPTEAGASG